jgi:DNA-binding MarR family transcriptional regulator
MGSKVTVAQINQNLKLFEVFRSLDVEMPVGQIVFFLNAAKLEGAHLREIADASGTKITTASRYLANLGEKDQFRQSGLGLLKAYENPENRRMKIIELTEAGQELLVALVGKKGV